MHELTDNEIRNQVKTLVSRERIGWTDHAEERMELRGIDKGMIKECLSKGYFKDRPHLSNKSPSINYEFTIAATIDGNRLEVACALYPGSRIVIKTCF